MNPRLPTQASDDAADTNTFSDSLYMYSIQNIT